jgi:hypothetical protein
MMTMPIDQVIAAPQHHQRAERRLPQPDQVVADQQQQPDEAQRESQPFATRHRLLEDPHRHRDDPQRHRVADDRSAPGRQQLDAEPGEDVPAGDVEERGDRQPSPTDRRAHASRRP